MNYFSGRVFRAIGIIFFGLTTVMNLLGGVGTSCVAFFTSQYPPFVLLIEEGIQWLYQGLVITTVLTGLAGIWVFVALMRRKKNGYRSALIVLVIGSGLAGIQYFSSLQLFGKAAPANIKFYFNVITLVLFLIFLIPGVRERVKFFTDEGGLDMNTTGGLAAIVSGVILQTTGVWAGPSHTFQGENWVHLLQNELNLSGIILIIVGVAYLVREFVCAFHQDYTVENFLLPKDR